MARKFAHHALRGGGSEGVRHNYASVKLKTTFPDRKGFIILNQIV